MAGHLSLRGAGLNCRDIKGYMSVKDTISRLNLTGNDRYLAYPAFQIMTRFATQRIRQSPCVMYQKMLKTASTLTFAASAI